MAKNKTAQRLAIMFTLFLLFSLVPLQSASADTITNPERKLKITETYTEYEWWLLSWAQNDLADCISIVLSLLFSCTLLKVAEGE